MDKNSLTRTGAFEETASEVPHHSFEDQWFWRLKVSAVSDFSG